MPFTARDERINKGGRPPGAQNKVSARALRVITGVLEAEEAKFMDELSQLKGRQFCELYLKLLSLVVPRQQDLSIATNDSLKEFLRLRPEEQAVIIGQTLAEMGHEDN